MTYFGAAMGSLMGAGKSMAYRAGKGAAVGGVAGLMGSNDAGGFFGGAIAGAAAGMAMPMASRALSNRFGSISGLARRGSATLGGLSTRMMNKGYGMMGGGAVASNMGAGMAYAGGLGQRGMAGLGRTIGANSVSINKWGGRALAGMGVGSAGMIGGSVIGSNRGY